MIRLETHVGRTEILAQASDRILVGRPLQPVPAQYPFDADTGIDYAQRFQKLLLPFCGPPASATAGEMGARRHGKEPESAEAVLSENVQQIDSADQAHILAVNRKVNAYGAESTFDPGARRFTGFFAEEDYGLRSYAYVESAFHSDTA